MQNNHLTYVWMFFLFILLSGHLVWGVFYVDDMQSKISILGIVVIIVAAFTSILTVGINNSKAKEREYDLHILKEKQKVFEHFYNCYFEMLKGVKKGNKGLSIKTEQEMLAFKKGLMNWGSDTLIKEFITFDNKILENPDEFNIIKDGNHFIKELRKELGFTDSKDTNVMSIILSAEARRELNENKLI